MHCLKIKFQQRTWPYIANGMAGPVLARPLQVRDRLGVVTERLAILAIAICTIALELAGRPFTRMQYHCIGLHPMASFTLNQVKYIINPQHETLQNTDL